MIIKSMALMPLTVTLLLISSVSQAEPVPEPRVSNLENHAAMISREAAMMRKNSYSSNNNNNYRDKNYRNNKKYYDNDNDYESDEEIRQYITQTALNSFGYDQKRADNDVQGHREEQKLLQNSNNNKNKDNIKNIHHQQYRYSFHHTYIPETERYLDGYHRNEGVEEEGEVKHNQERVEEKATEARFPADEDDAEEEMKSGLKKLVLGFVDRIFGSQKGTKHSETSSGSEPPFYEHSESSHEMSPADDARFNSMDWSQYEHEVVLRFYWTSSRERAAFLNAANTLVLDVWRVGKHSGDVRLHSNRVRNFLRLLPKSMRCESKEKEEKEAEKKGKQSSYSVLIHDLEHAVYNAFPTYQDTINLDTRMQLAIEELNKQTAQMQQVVQEHGPDSPITQTKTEESRAAILGLFHTTSELFFQDYRDLSTISSWLKMLQQTFPNQIRSVVIGQTHEGRDLVVYHIYSSEHEGGEKKKTIVLSSGIHAREWVSVSSSLFMLYQLLVNQGKPAEQYVLKHLDFLVVPVMNPDGYVYTWEHDRLWRKNRQDTGVSICNGIDIDSSFNYHWTPSVGTPCSESYAGQTPLEALEAFHFTNYINMTAKDHQYFGYIDLHSYSQTILYPYGYSCDAETRDQENLLELAYGLAKAIRWTSAKHYEVLPACEDRELYPDDGAGGCALDFMYKMHAIWAYQIKLRDTGNHGFLLPKKYIAPVGKEIYSALRYFCDFILSSR